MLNEPPSGKKRPVHPLERTPDTSSKDVIMDEVARTRRPHPLEQRPSPLPAAEQERPQAILHIPTVKPYLTYILVAVNVAIYGIMFLFPKTEAQIFQFGANDPQQVLDHAQYYRLVTAMFIHASEIHILFNAYVLYSFGTQLESYLGSLRFGLIYFLGGLAGSVASVVLGYSSGAISVGASGAIFAIIGGMYVFLHQHQKLFGPRGQAARRNLLMMGVMNLAFGVISNLPGSSVRIDNWGHIGGLVGGLVLAWYINPYFLWQVDKTSYGGDPEQVHLVVYDTNPLSKRYAVLSLYSAGLIAILIVGVLFVARGF